MSNSLNPKLRIKFLREKTLADTPVEAGNLIVTMDSENFFFDVLSTNNEVKRIGINGDLSYDEYEGQEVIVPIREYNLLYEDYKGQNVTVEE